MGIKNYPVEKIVHALVDLLAPEDQLELLHQLEKTPRPTRDQSIWSDNLTERKDSLGGSI